VKIYIIVRAKTIPSSTGAIVATQG